MGGIHLENVQQIPSQGLGPLVNLLCRFVGDVGGLG